MKLNSSLIQITWRDKLKSPKRIRNPYYNDINLHQVIPAKRAEVTEDDWDEDLIDMFNNKQQKANKIAKSERARNRRKEARNAKEDRLYGE